MSTITVTWDMPLVDLRQTFRLLRVPLYRSLTFEISPCNNDSIPSRAYSFQRNC